MIKYLLKRLGQTVIVVFIISVIAFMLLHMIPEDPVYKMFGSEITKEQHDMYYQNLGLDKPLLTQYLNFMGGFFAGNMGWSYNNSAPVSELIGERIGRTVFLGLCASALGMRASGG